MSQVLCYFEAMAIPSLEENFEELFVASPQMFFEGLKEELVYYRRTKIITFLDIYRVRKRLIPMMDVWITSRDKLYESLLNTNEILLLQALRTEHSLSVVKDIANENRHLFKSMMTLFISTLPENN